MSNRISRLKNSSDIVFKKLVDSIDVFVVVKGEYSPANIKYISKEVLEKKLKFEAKNVMVLDSDGTTVLAMNFLDTKTDWPLKNNQ